MAYDDDYDGMDANGEAMDMASNRGLTNGDSPAISLSSNDGDSIIEDAVEIIEEAKEEDEEKEEKREQTLRVIVDQPKKTKKKKKKLDEGLTTEEKREYKQMQMEEKRATLSERKLRLEQRKRKVEDEQFKRSISPEQIGAYRKAKIITQSLTPQTPQMAQPARAEAKAKVWTPQEMIGSVRSMRQAKPSHPVITSQSKRASYMTSRGSLHKATAPKAQRANYFAKPNTSGMGPARGMPKLNLMGFKAKKKKIKSRWKKLW